MKREATVLGNRIGTAAARFVLFFALVATMRAEFWLISGIITATDHYNENDEYEWTEWSTDYHGLTIPVMGQLAHVDRSGSWENWTGLWNSSNNFFDSNSDPGPGPSSWLGTSEPLRWWFNLPEGSYTLEVGANYNLIPGPYTILLEYAPYPAPTTSFTVTPDVGPASVVFQFNASATTFSAGTITKYEWDFDNNGTYDYTSTSSPLANFNYQNTGSTALTFTARLRVTGIGGLVSPISTSTTRQITVNPAGTCRLTVQNGTAPTSFAWPGTPITLTASAPAGSSQSFANWTVVSGVGTFGNANSANTTFNIGNGDAVVRGNFRPSPPGSLAASSLTYNAVTLTWAASSGGNSLANYKVYMTRAGSTLNVGTLSNNTLTVTMGSLQPSTSYSYYVTATDQLGNVSDPSNSVSITTPAIPDADGDLLPDHIESLLGIQGNPNPSGSANLNLNIHRPQP